MPDLAAQIRERLDDPKQYLENGIEPLIDALLAVLEEHRTAGGDDPVCGRCVRHRTVAQCKAMRSPCWTVRVIAEKLGIEVP